MFLPTIREEKIMSLNDPYILYCMQLGMENLDIFQNNVVFFFNLVIFYFSGTFGAIPRTNVQCNT
jgi:hypothetical protein